MENDFPEVFWQTLKEDRGDYFVTYRPADRHLPFAAITLTFPKDEPQLEQVEEAMNDEAHCWLKRYDVPVMVSAFDAKDDLIRLSEHPNECHLMAFVSAFNGKIVKRWGLLRNEELPMEKSDPICLRKVYADVPFRLADDVRREAIRDARFTGRGLRILVLLLFGIPVAVEIVALGVTLKRRKPDAS